LAAGLRPDPLGELIRSPDSLVAMRGFTSIGREERRGKGKEEGILLRGQKRRSEERGDGNGGMKGNASRINDGCSYFTMHYITN